jgi:Glycosyl hydrolase family 26
MILAVSSCGKAEQPIRIFGLSSQGPNFGVDAAAQAAGALERKLDVVNLFMAWEWEQPLPTRTLKRSHELGALPAITWEPWHPSHGADQPRYALERISAGDFDAYIKRWAKAAASYGQPMQLRFAHEMNGTWYPWSVGLNGNSASDYRKAYRHVHDLFIKAGAVNVQWVWSIDAAHKRPQGLKNLKSYYPGDQYVDVVGVDGYNGGPTGATWDPPDQLFSEAIDAATAVAPNRPVWIYETGSGDARGDKAQWITDLFVYLERTPVAGLVWFNFDKHGEQNWLLDSSPDVEAAARAALANW